MLNNDETKGRMMKFSINGVDQCMYISPVPAETHLTAAEIIQKYGDMLSDDDKAELRNIKNAQK